LRTTGSALAGSKIQEKPFAQHPAHLVQVGLETGTVWDEDPEEGFLASSLCEGK